LLDEYDVYEQLMTYWHDIMHDDVFLVMNDGWVEASKPHKTIEDKDRKLSETPDLVLGSGKNAQKYKMDLLPPTLIVARYFADEQANVDKLNAKAEAVTPAIDEYVDEHSGEEGLLADAMEDDKITKSLATARLREAKREGVDTDEISALEHLIQLYNHEAAAKKAAKQAQAALNIATLKKYGDLTKADVQVPVLDDKWAATIRDRVTREVNALTFALVTRIQELGKRYARTVGDLDLELERLEVQVAGHLASMGVTE
jgi:type I restriction enzyme M protein